MLKENEISIPTSCLNKAADDEPIFVLKSTDELAPATVRQWAVWYRQSKQAADEWTSEREAKYREAMQLAAQMEEWRALKVDGRLPREGDGQ